MTALPGDGGIRTRRVAILVADGVDGDAVAVACSALTTAGAEVHLIAPRLGAVKASVGAAVAATGTLENSPSVLFDGLVLPDGADGVERLRGLVEVMDFISNQYRHGKTILALGAGGALLGRAGIDATLQDGHKDPGILIADAGAGGAVEAFIAALAKHRHPQREAAATAKRADLPAV
ncbi:MAG: DJ-1/PfpI family protein [Nannocystis sp.]|nr:DJ-1/PfpI family protein [Nannocystis sp.]